MGHGRELSRIIGLLVAAAALLTPSAAGAADSAWVDRALADQYELGSPLPLRNAPWVGTHNSFNSTAEMGPTLSTQDSNQRITLTDQLDLGIRSLELDLHWFPSASGGGFAPVVCHATGQHLGCTVEKPLGPVLEEIGAWLREPANREHVLFLYLEDHLDTEQGYDAGAATVEDTIGDLVFRPPAGACTELPLALTRDLIRAAGKQVIIVSDCGIGSAWPAVAFSWESHEETRPRGYTDFPDCGPDFSRETYDSTIVRYFEDSTRLTATAGTLDDGITAPTAAAMARCGVDLLGLDQLVPGDPRLEALVWSWAPGEPRSGRCALERVSDRFPFGRWRSARCAKRRQVACVTESGRWRVPGKRVRARRAPATCARRDAVHAVPRSGFEAQRLRLAMERKGAGAVWIDFRRAGGAWAPR